MAWSIFSEGGGKGAAVTWAKDLLANLGVPQSNQNINFIYDWEVSEGGGGKYNPLNQGPVPGHPELTTTGQQFGGGAADFASWQAGITGASDYLHMSSYSGILAALKTSNYAGARSALIASPWAASHYGGGSSFSSETAPGASPLGSGGGSVATGSTTGITVPGIGGLSVSGITQGIMDTFLKAIGLGSMKDAFERLGLIILGFALVILGIHLLSGGSSGSGSTVVVEEPGKEEGSSSTSKSASRSEIKTASKKSAETTGASEAVEAAAAA
jgi:hypothetical protein